MALDILGSTVVPDNPELVDRFLSEFQTQLIAKITWLKHALGRAQSITDKDGKKFPGVHVSDKDYFKLYPDRSVGNFSFFYVSEDYKTNFIKNQRIIYEADFGLVFTFDLQTIYPDAKSRNIENVKKLIGDTLLTLRLSTGSFDITGVSEKWDNLYPGYTLKEEHSQYLMHPFGALIFTGKLIFNHC